MYVKKKSNVIYRSYESFGFITDNRNFGYKQTNNKRPTIGEKILSESGSIFFSVLERCPLRLSDLVKKISLYFPEVDPAIIEEDVKAFYFLLDQDGFVVSGLTPVECMEKDKGFSYHSSVTNEQTSSSKLIPQDLENSTQEFFEEYYNGKPQLTSLHLELTSKCNERCIHCYIPHDNKLSHIDTSLFYSILDQCRDLRLLHLTLSGGEPMLHKNFCDFLRRCREYDFSVNVLSNLTILDDVILAEMKANPLLGVQVSLYAMDPKVHDEITQVKGSFEKTMKGIRLLIENDIPLQISCPVMKQNKDYYTEVVIWAKKYNIQVGDDYAIIGSYDHVTTNLNCRLSINEIESVLYDKVSTDALYLKQLEAGVEKSKYAQPTDYVCSVCNSSICITENGDVYPCAGWQGYVVGNLKDTSLFDVWNNSEKVHYLRSLRKQDFPKCVSCADKAYCTMCMVRNANESPTGDPLAINEYFCRIARLNKNILHESRAKLVCQ